MPIECYNVNCSKHACHEGHEEPFCFERECIFKEVPPVRESDIKVHKLVIDEIRTLGDDNV